MPGFATWMRHAPALAVAGFLSGCTLIGKPVGSVIDQVTGIQAINGAEWLYVLEVTSVINTDKTLFDHVVSIAYGRDCSTIRYLDGDYYCNRPPPPETPLFCYPSLGDVVCYREDNPYGAQQEMDWPKTRSGRPDRT